MNELWYFLGGCFAGGISIWLTWWYSDWKYGIRYLRRKKKIIKFEEKLKEDELKGFLTKIN